MKYKDLNIGDWFTFVGETFIKTYCSPLKAGYDFCLSKKWFGMCFAQCREETEVEFVSRLTVENPAPKKEADETIMNAPTSQFLSWSWQFDNRETIFIKTLLQGEIYVLALNGDTAGLWTRSTPCIPVKIIPRIDLKYAENI